MALKKNYDPLAGLFGSNTASTKVSNETKVNKAEQTSAKSESNEAGSAFMNPPEEMTKEQPAETPEEPAEESAQEQAEEQAIRADEAQQAEEQPAETPKEQVKEPAEEQAEEQDTRADEAQQQEEEPAEKPKSAQELAEEQPAKTEEEAVEQLAEPQEQEPAEEQSAKTEEEQQEEQSAKTEEDQSQDSQLSMIEKLMEEANIAPEALIGFLKSMSNTADTSQQKTDMEQPEQPEQPEQTEITEQKKETVAKIEHTPEELAYIQVGLLIPKEIKRFVEKTAKQNGIGASALLEQILNHEYEIKSPIYENEIEDYLDDFIKISKSNIRTNYRIPTYLKTFLADSAAENGVNQNVMLAFFVHQYQKELERTKWASLANRTTM